MKRVLLSLILIIGTMSISCSKENDLINYNNGNDNQEITEEEKETEMD